MDVFVDDFIELAQGGPRRREALRNTLLHTIDDVLEPHPNHPTRKEAASVKKMKKGEAAWATRKTALGWIIDSLSKMLEMPPHRTERLQKIFDDL